MNLETCRAIFTLAGVSARNFHQVANGYWPDVAEYADIRRDSPWWLVETARGLIQIGWRKRVISINWSSTMIRGMVTTDPVTKENYMVHAWSYAKAVEYLTEWRSLAERHKAMNPLDASGSENCQQTSQN